MNEGELAVLIITTGKIIKIEAGEFRFERSSETPGLITVFPKDGVPLKLPAHDGSVEQFCNTYRRCAAEEIGYRTRKSE